jgi:hypothetical protein
MKPGMTGEAFELDVRDCDGTANRVAAMEPATAFHGLQAAPGRRPPGPMASQRQIERERAYTDCMQSKGYIQTQK